MYCYLKINFVRKYSILQVAPTPFAVSHHMPCMPVVNAEHIETQ